jgi:hypothetical protein
METVALFSRKLVCISVGRFMCELPGISGAGKSVRSVFAMLVARRGSLLTSVCNLVLCSS